MKKRLLILPVFFCSLTTWSQTLSTIVLKDPFTDNRFRWAVEKGDSVEYEISGGKYIITNTSVKSFKSFRNIYFNKSLPYSVSATLAWYSGVNNTGYGIIINGNAQGNEVELAISGNGYFRILAYSDRKQIPISNGWQKSTLVKTGSGIANSVRIEVSGDFYTFYLNDTVIDTATLTRFRGGERAGFFIYNKQQVLFDDFEAKQWTYTNQLPGKIIGKTSSFAGPVSARPEPSKTGGIEPYYYKNANDPVLTDEDYDEMDDDEYYEMIGKYTPKAGLIDKDGYRLVDPVFKQVSKFEEGRSFVSLRDTSYGVIDDKLNMITPMIFDYSSKFENGYAIVRVGKLYGMIDKEGKMVLPAVYSYLTKPENGILYAELGSRAGIISLTGEEIIPYGKINLSRTYSGLRNGLMASADASGKLYGIIDKTGKWVVEPAYRSMVAYNDGSYVFSVPNPKNALRYLYGLMDKNGKIVLQPVYGSLRVHKSNLVIGNEETSSTDFRDKIKARYGLADKTGKMLTEMKYLMIRGTSDTSEYFTAFAETKDNSDRYGKTGLLDKRGKEVVPCLYENKISVDGSVYASGGTDYVEGLMNVYKEGKWGYINNAGKVAIPFVFTSARAFYGGRASVVKDGKSIYINTSGKEVPKPSSYDYMNPKTVLPPIRK